MNYQKVSWTALKGFINTTQSKLFYIEENDFYDLFTSTGSLSLTCTIKKLDPASSDQTDFETNYKSIANSNLDKPIKQSSFSSKEEDGKKIFTRTHGTTYYVVSGSNDCIFTVPYPQAKINAIEIVNTEIGDTISLQILDDDNGTISTIPNYMLNQFGFDVGVPEGFYVRESKYDADLFQGLKIKIIYNTSTAKNITVNYILHELK